MRNIGGGLLRASTFISSEASRASTALLSQLDCTSGKKAIF